MVPRPERTPSLHAVIQASDERDWIDLLGELAHRVDPGDPRRAPRVLLLVSPCRSGTTGMMRAFGAVGVPSYYQVVKNLLRWQMLGEDRRWRLPQTPDGTILLKETVGPFAEVEARFDPLATLLAAGVPAEKLQLIVMGRAPLSTWSSWDEWDGEWTTVEKLISAYRTVEEVRQRAYHLSVPTVTLLYEALRDNQIEPVIRRLFERLDVPYAPIAVRGWRDLPPLDFPGSNTTFPDEPPMFIVPGVHARVEEADGLVYFSRTKGVSRLEGQDVAAIAEADLASIWQGWRIRCQEDLGVTIGEDRDWQVVEGA